MKTITHPFILTSYGATVTKRRVGIIMELCERGDLQQCLLTYVEENDASLPFYEKKRMVTEICDGMGFLHSKNIIHRDLKPGNVLVTEHYVTKLMVSIKINYILCLFDPMTLQSR